MDSDLAQIGFKLNFIRFSRQVETTEVEKCIEYITEDNLEQRSRYKDTSLMIKLNRLIKH